MLYNIGQVWLKINLVLLKMMKKLVVGIIILFGLWGSESAMAQQGARVILDLQNEPENVEQRNDVAKVIEMGMNYWSDVKEYDELLDSDSLNKDFSADIMAKYPEYSKETAETWQRYVKKGIKGYRFYKDMKQKLIRSILGQEMPLVVDDDQYEMGDEEIYVESDRPVVIKDFKKVVAYSGNPRDQLAAREKYAKDANQTRPSEIIARYKRALLEKDWATLFGAEWKEFWQSVYDAPEGKADAVDMRAAAIILSKFNGIGIDGEIAGVALVELKQASLALLNDYKNYDGLKIDFAKSENFALTKTAFVLPRVIEDSESRVVLGYTTKFPVYFEGKAVDVKQPVKIRAELRMNLCKDEECQQVALNPELELEPKEDVDETTFATYVNMASQNTPREKNAENFELGNLTVVKDVKTGKEFLRLEVESDDAARLQGFVWGKEAKYFAKAEKQLDNNKTVMWFPIIDPSFDPIGKDISFWLATEGVNQYIGTLKAEEEIANYGNARGFWGEVLVLALWGGMLLNLMPFGLVGLAQKVIDMTKFGGCAKPKVRKEFLDRGWGILAGFAIVAGGYFVMMARGNAVSWMMQLQNVLVVAVLIWITMAIMLQMMGVVNFVDGETCGKLLKSEQVRGMGLALLSASFAAPYVGTAVCAATAYGKMLVVATVMCVGVGLAIPYWVVGVWPQIGAGVPRPGQWANRLRMLMILLLAGVLAWLMGVLYEHTSMAEVWCWIVYLVVAFLILGFHKVLMAEVNKMEDVEAAKIIGHRLSVMFGTVVLMLVVASVIDAKMSAAERYGNVEQVVFTKLNKDLIDDDVEHGRKVLVKVEAKWCMMCRINNALVFDTSEIKDEMQRNNLKVLELDWTNYNEEIFELMQKYDRLGPPFYILFSPKFPDGMVLPQVMNNAEMKKIIRM